MSPGRRDERSGRDDRGQRDQRGRRDERGKRDDRGGRGQRDDRGRRAGPAPAPRDRPTSAERRGLTQAEYDGPPLSDDVTGRELGPDIANQLRSLPDRLALRVSRHLVMAGRLADTDPDTAFAHARAARARAARVAAVREAYGELAYLTGQWAEALRELKTVRRMTGRADHLPVMADCERALGRPERALSLARDPAVASLDIAGRAELAIVTAGARRDRGEFDAAVSVLEGADLRTRSRAEWVARLRYAYADALLAAGRDADALEWFHRAAAVDGQGSTDALERAEALQARDQA